MTDDEIAQAQAAMRADEQAVRDIMRELWISKVPDAVVVPPDLDAMWEGDLHVEARNVSGRGFCLLRKFIFTTGLLTGVTYDAMGLYYTARYCYPSLRDAKEALRTWDGVDDPGGRWVKEKVSGRLGPEAKPRPVHG